MPPAFTSPAVKASWTCDPYGPSPAGTISSTMRPSRICSKPSAALYASRSAFEASRTVAGSADDGTVGRPSITSLLRMRPATRSSSVEPLRCSPLDSVRDAHHLVGHRDGLRGELERALGLDHR